MLKTHLPTRLKKFLQTEVGLFSIQCALFFPIIGIGAALILPSF